MTLRAAVFAAAGAVVLTAMLAVLPAGSARADPMRPLTAPAGTPAAAAATAAASAAGAPAAPDGGSEGGERLVAIRADTRGRLQALFGERWLAAGERLGSATIAAIDGNSVTLSAAAQAAGAPRARRTLYLLPPLTPAEPAAPPAAAAPRAPVSRSHHP